MTNNFNSTILVAPLDWGLGHSTRCIPLIKELLAMGCNVIIAAEGAQENLLKQEFPQLKFVQLPGYRISYTSVKRLFALKIFGQLPKILRAIRFERKWLENFLANNNIDAVISDNRYGLHHHSILCIFITHQLTVKAPFEIAEKFIQLLNYRLINKFNECWVPDFKGEENIAGALSHPKKLPAVPVKYLGCLSRFKKENSETEEYDLLIVLSGPEPQRTVFEHKVLSELQSFKGNALLVRGLPGSDEILQSTENITFENHLSAIEMQDAFNKSKLIISRTGYTTVMDICKLQKKAILIPTPGQTEQEYLALHLSEQGWCITFNQNNFSLNPAIEKAKTFPFQIPAFDMNGYKKVITDFIKTLEK